MNERVCVCAREEGVKEEKKENGGERRRRGPIL